MAGHPYDPSRYTDTAHKPNAAPQSVNASFDFSNKKLEISWMIPFGAAPMYESNPCRWTSTDIEIRPYFKTPGGKATCPTNWVQNSNMGGDSLKLDRSACIYVRNLESGTTIATSFSQAYDNEAFYPYTNYILERVEVTVIAHNSWGGHGATTTKVARLDPPNVPTWGAPTFATATGVAKSVLSKPSEASSGSGLTAESAYTQREWAQTMYRMVRKDYTAPSRVSELVPWSHTSQDGVDVQATLSDVQNLSQGQWVHVEWQAFSEGMGGTLASVSGRSSAASLSASGKVATASHMFAWPAQGSVTKVTASSLDYSGGSVTILAKIPQSDTAPVDTIVLQRLKNTTAKTPEAAASEQGWSDVATVNASNCGGFSDTVASSLPDRKKHTWYRVKTVHDAYTSYGVPFEATCLYRGSNILTDEDLAIDSVSSGDDGKSLVVSLSWNGDDSDGREVSWSTKPDAWESSEQPTAFDVTWNDANARTATFVIRGVEEGVPVYVKARLYHDTDDYREFGDYVTPVAAQYPCAPVTVPSDVQLVAPAFAERGTDVPLRWTFQSGAEQVAWTLWSVDDGDRVALMSGEDSLGSCILPSELIGDADSLSLQVSVTTGGDWADSEEVALSVADRPTLALTCDSELAENAFVAEIATDCASVGVAIAVYATGTATSGPAGNVSQPAGEVLWSTYSVPTLTPESEGFSAEIPAPRMALHDGCRYVVAATLVDLETGLESEPATAEFTVAWDHTATLPAAVSITPDAQYLMATIEVTRGLGQELADVYDLYRVTPDGVSVAGVGLAFNRPYIDNYAPFSSDGPCSYRISVRTYDGDEAWGDYEYSMAGGKIRLDWGGSSLELPYNIELDDSFTKDFEPRKYLDGTVNGHWNRAVQRNATASTQIVKGVDAEKAESLRAVAQHAGPVFVRMPDGCAYPADVSVGKVTRSYGSRAVDVSLTITQVAMPDEYTVTGNDFDWDEG